MTRLFPASLLCSVLLASSAHAADKNGYAVKGDTASYEVAFDDDSLLAPGTNAYGEWLKVGGRSPKVMLLRPRTSFVPEMLTSVNGL